MFDENGIKGVLFNPLAVRRNTQRVHQRVPDFWMAFGVKNYCLRVSLGHCLSSGLEIRVLQTIEAEISFHSEVSQLFDCQSVEDLELRTTVRQIVFLVQKLFPLVCVLLADLRSTFASNAFAKEVSFGQYILPPQ